jgi:hypothetical protein
MKPWRIAGDVIPPSVLSFANRRRTLLGAQAESALARPMTAVEHTALDLALRDAVDCDAVPTLPRPRPGAVRSFCRHPAPGYARKVLSLGSPSVTSLKRK